MSAAATFEDAWGRIRSQQELEGGAFWLGFVFTTSLEEASELYRQSSGLAAAGGNVSSGIWPATPEELRTVADAVDREVDSRHRPIWVIAPFGSREGSEAERSWAAGWIVALHRLNEWRDGLRRRHAGGLVLVLAPSLRSVVRFEAPDLWSYRSLVVELEPQRRDHVPAHQESTRSRVAIPASWGMLTDRLPEPSITDGLSYALRDIYRVANPIEGLASAEAFLADAGPARGAVLATIAEQAHSAGDGVRATAAAADALESGMPLGRDRLHNVLALVASSDHDSALAALSWRVELERVLAAGRPTRSLKVALDALAARLESAEDIELARAAFEESLAIAIRLAAEFGNRPEWLEDALDTFDDVGRVREAQADLIEALEAYSESLRLSRRLVDDFGTRPEWLGRVARSLSNIGRVRDVLGDSAGALVLFRECHDWLERAEEAARDFGVSGDELFLDRMAVEGRIAQLEQRLGLPAR